MLRTRGAGKAACLHLFARVRTLSPAFWRSLPVCRDDPDNRLAQLLGRAGAGAVPYAAIAVETERSLAQGVRTTGPLALILLAAVARHEDGCADAALQLAQVALDLAGQHGRPHLRCVQALHAALIAPLAGTQGEAAMQSGAQAARALSLRAGCVGELGLSIAHEVNQPLAAISLHAAAALKWLRRATPDVERALISLEQISAAGRQASDIVRSVQQLALRQENDMGKVPVDQAVADALRLLDGLLCRNGIAVELAFGLGDCIIHANRVQLQQVVTNLLVNAIEALAGGEPGGRPRRIRVQTRHYNAYEVEISVTDNGPGIAPRHRDFVFGSMFSTKPNSTGMGLSISLAIVRAHGGNIAYEPAEPHGACFRFRLPVRPR